MEKEVKTIGEEVVKAVETMKEAGKAEKEAPKEQPVKEEKPTDTPAKGKKSAKKDEAAKLQEEINRKTKELEKCLAELERKKEISRQRTAFINAMDKLDEATGKLKEENSFETPLYKLRFVEASSYGNNSDIFTISNRFLLEEFTKFMKKKIQSKIEELEQLLISE
ncbi:hypothetical protein [Bacteroides helcogenes]|uniref:Uncharacterized protein n=1 Tax=Bacteroides helcogenes (strain ATCC 35417 / DSM 20613 / JCM 6297 / CCUG 15421 / P 36-108) TaxID=693979 RepID=E6SU99_BACT6|nr:hypothetical protein [Bacteroides helcogenes]ADV44372.1 hypothetical protein Bache_2406 [Bacteroides helcogenes P 36-108]